MSDPLAYFITLSAYGDRVHGDARGSVDRRRNVMDEPPLNADPGRAAREARLIKGPPMRFDESLRRSIEHSFGETCGYHCWSLIAVNCRTNHVHLVVSAPETNTSEVLHRLKSRSTRALREAGLVSGNARVWSRHGSTRYLWTDADVGAAVDYTMNQQGLDLPGTNLWKERHLRDR